MPLQYEVRIYCPFEDLSPFLVPIEAPSKEEAVKRVIGKTVTCPVGHSFEVEDYFIIGVYPSSRIPLPPYKTLPLNHEKPPPWLLGAKVVEEKPLPIGSEPVKSPYLKKMVTDSLATLVYEQEVRSREYPDLTFHIQYERDVFTKFLDQAKRLVQVGKYREAVLYLLEHSPDLTVQIIADILGLGYDLIYDRIRELLKEGKVTESGTWRGKSTYGPMRRKSEEELLLELTGILTLEMNRPPTPQEIAPYRRVLRRKKRSELQQKIVSFLESM